MTLIALVIIITSFFASVQPCLALETETIGIIVGCSCGGVVLIIGLFILCYCCKQSKSKSKEDVEFHSASNGFKKVDTNHLMYNMNDKRSGLQNASHENKGYEEAKNLHPLFNLPFKNFSQQKNPTVTPFQNIEFDFSKPQNSNSLNSNNKDNKHLASQNDFGLIRTLSLNNFKTSNHSDSNFILKTPKQALEDRNSASNTRMYFSSDDIWTSAESSRQINIYQEFSNEFAKVDVQSDKESPYVQEQPNKSVQNSNDCVIGDEIFTEHNSTSLSNKNHVISTHQRLSIVESTPFSKRMSRLYSTSSVDPENRSISSEVFQLQGHTLADKAFDFLNDYQLKEAEDQLNY